MRTQGAALVVMLIACFPAAAYASCTVNVNTGTITYKPFDPDGRTFSGVIEIDCGPGSLPATAQIAFDGGSSGDPLRRAMRGGRGGSLAYQIYLPTGTVLGDGSRGTQTFSTRVTSQRTLVPFVGRIFPRQTVASGPYRDELTVTFGL
jgi:spore coat protein U-like protein